MVTPVEVQSKFPEGVPVADAASLTKIVFVVTTPDNGVNETELPNPLLVVFDTSKPDGAVTTRLSVKSVPATVKVCSADSVPKQDENTFNVPVSVIEGISGQGADVVTTRENLLNEPTSLMQGPAMLVREEDFL